MINARSVLLVLTIICLNCVCAEDEIESRKKHHIKHSYIYGTALLPYLTFLAIKVKLVLVIGVIFTVLVFGGKLFALLKYADYKNSYYHHPKEVYISSPHESSEYIHDHPDFPGTVEIDHPFKRFSIINHYGNPKGNENLAGYKRSFPNVNYFQKIFSFLMRLNLTERIFKEMKMDQIECRKKFVCETKFIAENSSLFRVILRLMSDSTFDAYKPKNKTTSMKECNDLYPTCDVS